MGSALRCTNCGRECRTWLVGSDAFCSVPPRAELGEDWRCGRCRPRRDDGHRLLCRTVRDRYGLSQRLWAHAMGVDARTVARWEIGAPEPTGTALELLHALDAAATANPRVAGIVRAHVRAKRRHAQLVADLLVKVAGGTLRRRRQQATGPTDGLVTLTIRVTRSERARAAVEAFRSGATVSQWVRGSLFREGKQADSRDKRH